MLVLAAKRYLRMLEMAEVPTNDFVYSPEHVVDYCRFAEKFHHFEPGLWQFTQLDADGNPDDRIILEPWQIWIESAIQGFRWRLTGERLVTTALEVVPRKSAKSLKATVAALFDLVTSALPAEIPIAAISRKSADDTLFGDLVKITNHERELCELHKIKVTQEEITKGDGRIFKLSSQGEKQDGLNPSLAIFEEGHAGAASVYRVVESAFGARPNALKRMITTAGYRAEGPGYDLLLEAQHVLNGEYEDWTIFAAIYTLDREDYTDKDTNEILWDKLLTSEELLYRANPMMGVSLDPAKVRTELLKGLKNRQKRKELARTRFNIWIGSGQALIDPGEWAACKRDIRLEDYVGRPCWIGVDLAQRKDMCAITLVFPEDTGEIAVFSRFFLPELSETVSNPDISDHIADWDDQGYLELTPGPLADHERVREEIQEFCEVFDVQVIACDPHQAHNTVKIFWDGDRPVMVYPNSAPTMTAPVDDILARITVETLWHDGNPVLAWNAQNVHGDRKPNGLVLPRKDKSDSHRKIDGFVALCFALGCIINPMEAKDPELEEKKKVDALVARGGALGYSEALGDGS